MNIYFIRAHFLLLSCLYIPSI